jgi:hypothetical protein
LVGKKKNFFDALANIIETTRCNVVEAVAMQAKRLKTHKNQRQKRLSAYSNQKNAFSLSLQEEVIKQRTFKFTPLNPHNNLHRQT